jgi:hypothetical protein
MPRSGARLLLATALVLGVASTSLGASADGIDPGKASAAQREQAQGHFLKGHELHGQGRFADALEEFRASHEIVASPNARLFSARCLRELGRVGEAYAEFGRAEVEARAHAHDDPRYARTGESAAEERRALAPKVAFVTLRIDNADASTTVKVAGEELGRAAWGDPLPLAPGPREVTVETKGRKPVVQTVTVAAGETKPLVFDAGAAPMDDAVGATTASPPPAPSGAGEDGAGLRTASFVAGGIGLVGLVAFATFGTLANGKFQDLETSCNRGPCPASRQSDIDAGRTDQTIANVGLAIGLIGVAAGVTLFLVSSPKKSPAPTARMIVGPTGLGGVF